MDTPTKQFVKEVLTGKNQFTFSFGTDCLYAINIKRGNPDLSMDVILVILTHVRM